MSFILSNKRIILVFNYLIIHSLTRCETVTGNAPITVLFVKKRELNNCEYIDLF